MKLVAAIILCLVFSCEYETHTYCWECQSYVYGEVVEDIYCGEHILAVDEYKERLMEFYEGGMTNIECQLLPDSIR